MNPIKLGYVGCGFMAQKVHIPNFLSIPECEMVALAEVRTELGRKVQGHYGIPRLYPHHLELAEDPDIEAVAVSADFSLQGEIARDLLAAGKHVERLRSGEPFLSSGQDTRTDVQLMEDVHRAHLVRQGVL
ncbi:MAG: Gfo/Idh/MocA family oxidoreductase [Chloroflexota bacterium]|nr:Gfo/Idh/MocA family oxidoreductase [Chloroflexota bacterium]